ncbi:MAG: SGNH/GDSL hydrolase family protein [Nocardioides sp.]
MTVQNRALGAALVAALLIPLAACSAADPPPYSSPPGATTPSPSIDVGDDETPATPPAAKPDRGAYPTYVALGDSYTAAPLASATDTDSGCLRSEDNYPALIARAMGGTRLDDVSCIGADTTSLVGVQRTLRGVVPAQFDALARNTLLVTVGMGGNDFGIFATMVGTCTSLRDRDPGGAPCREQQTASGRDRLRASVAKLDDRLAATVAGIRDRSPRAEIVVVGYPELISADRRCPGRLPLAAGDHAYAAGINAALAETQKRAATRAGVTYIDVYAASRGHDICSDDPWVNGAVTSADTALAFHPLLAEQQAVANLVLTALTEHGVAG